MYRFLLSRLRARFRVLAVIVSFLVAFAAPQSWGLGLGEIELDSALNQKFKATIELFDAASLEPGEIIVSLGSTEDFERIGVERFFFLTDLSFEITYDAAGTAQVLVTSRRPITEPYLNFLVEVLWPSGRMLKEFTVLLDPPTFSAAAAPAVSAPQQNRQDSASGRVQRVEPARSGTQVQVTPRPGSEAQPSPLDQGITGDEYGMTDRDDTLWSIALRARPNGVSVQQTMLAIQQLNPDAFINGNINLLKAGYVLRLPDEAQARALTEAQAIGEVARHEEEWRAYNRGEAIADRGQRAPAPARDSTSDLRSPLDASSATTAATAAVGTDGELKIVAEDGDSTTGVGSQVASVDLDAALEETDRLGRRVDELTYQLDREKELASNEISVKERQIEVKDQQIAELQAQLAAAQQQAATAGPGTQNQNQSTSTEAAGPWWQSPLVMYGGAGVLVLLLVGGMVTARKRRAVEEENDYFDAEEAFAENERLEPAVDAFEAEDDEEDDDKTRVATTAADDVEGFDEELEGSQTSDVIGEADIYIAYGRFPQAIGLLMGVLEDDPERNDVRLKLLEVYAETGDRAAFDQHMTSLVEYCDDEDALLLARELESRLGEDALTLDEVIAGGEEAGGEKDATITVENELDTDETAATGELADLEFVSDDVSSADDSAEQLASADAARSKESALDFELELDELDTETASADAEEELETRGAGDQLGGDLGLDFDPDEVEDSAAADGASDEPSKGLDFGAMSIDTSDGGIEEEATGSSFAKSEELTIDADLQEAAASISSEAAGIKSAAAAEEEGDLAVETEADEGLLDDLDFETAAQTADEEFEFEDEGDSANTKLDLARAYIDMGDADGARDILKEVLGEGNSDQQQKAQALLESL